MTGPCPICKRPRTEWPSIFRSDDACSVVCEKALTQQPSEEPAIAPSACSE